MRHPNPNVFHRIIASRTPTILKPATGHTGAELGVTLVSGGLHYSAILRGRIEEVVAGLPDPAGGLIGQEWFQESLLASIGETTAHETVHFWVHSGGDGQGHCTYHRWQHDSLNCLLHTPYAGPGHADGLVDLHYENHGADSEYMTIRRAADPVKQQ